MDLLIKTFKDLYDMVLSYQGKENPDAAALTKAKERVNDGYANFMLAYDWYFLRKGRMLTTTVGVNEYNLPEDFSMFKSTPCNPTSAAYPWPTEIDDEQLTKLMSLTNTNGTPYYYSRTTKHTPETGVINVLRFFPTPDAIINYVYSYRPIAFALDNDLDRPFCPVELLPLLKGFIMMEVESHDEENADEAWTARVYKTLLPKAIEFDSKQKPAHVGNAMSMSREELLRHGTVYFNGTEV